MLMISLMPEILSEEQNWCIWAVNRGLIWLRCWQVESCSVQWFSRCVLALPQSKKPLLPTCSRVTAEVKYNLTNTVVCRVQGEWNSVLEFTYSNGETKYVDLAKLAVTKKRVRPLEKQDPFESRCVDSQSGRLGALELSHVTKSLYTIYQLCHL